MKDLPAPRHAIFRKFKDPATQEIIDRGIVIWFPGPRSFTGEDTCEFHVHGSPAVISCMLSNLNKLPDFQPAEPGEFTRRGFHLGKFDLTEVEGLADLLAAETDEQRKHALIQMEGSLKHLYNSLRHTLIKCVAHMEAYIDFSEDENIEMDTVQKVNDTLNDLKEEIQKHILYAKCGERLRDGVRTAIIGKPNVGKSSLLNILCKRPAAIVTSKAGTTRDILEFHMNIGGYPALLADTAGLHGKTQDEIEIEGITRAKHWANSADLLLLVVDTSTYVTNNVPPHNLTFEQYFTKYIHSLELDLPMKVLQKKDCHVKSSELCFSNKHCIVVLNKCDLVPSKDMLQSVIQNYSNVVAVSCKTEDGLPDLICNMTTNLAELCGRSSLGSPHLIQARHQHHLQLCLNNIEDYFDILTGGDIVLATQKLRNSLREIGKITGHVNIDHILDVIFKDFCIGK